MGGARGIRAASSSRGHLGNFGFGADSALDFSAGPALDCCTGPAGPLGVAIGADGAYPIAAAGEAVRGGDNFVLGNACASLVIAWYAASVSTAGGGVTRMDEAHAAAVRRIWAIAISPDFWGFFAHQKESSQPDEGARARPSGVG